MPALTLKPAMMRDPPPSGSPLHQSLTPLYPASGEEMRDRSPAAAGPNPPRRGSRNGLEMSSEAGQSAGQSAGQGMDAVLLAHRAQLIRFLESHGAGDAAEDLFQELWMRVT